MYWHCNFAARQKSVKNSQLNSVGVTDKVERNVSLMTIKTFFHETLIIVQSTH